VEKVPPKQLHFAKPPHTEVLKLPLPPSVKHLQLLPYRSGRLETCVLHSLLLASTWRGGRRRSRDLSAGFWLFSTPTTVFLKNKAACQEPRTPVLDKLLLPVHGTADCLLLTKAAPQSKLYFNQHFLVRQYFSLSTNFP